MKSQRVYPKDHANNKSGKVTLYQVTGLFQRPNMPVTLGDNVPYAGQSAGWGHEKESPLVVGQRVVVIFIEGDPQRPVIMASFPYIGPKSTPQAAQTSAEAPQDKALVRDVEVVIDKEGNASIQLAEGKALTFKDSAGNVLVELVQVGGSYEVHLGGNSGLDTLLRSQFVDTLNIAVGTHVPVPNDGGAALKTVLLNALTSSVKAANSTTITKAK